MERVSKGTEVLSRMISLCKRGTGQLVVTLKAFTMIGR